MEGVFGRYGKYDINGKVEFTDVNLAGTYSTITSTLKSINITCKKDRIRDLIQFILFNRNCNYLMSKENELRNSLYKKLLQFYESPAYEDIKEIIEDALVHLQEISISS